MPIGEAKEESEWVTRSRRLQVHRWMRSSWWKSSRDKKYRREGTRGSASWGTSVYAVVPVELNDLQRLAWMCDDGHDFLTADVRQDELNGAQVGTGASRNVPALPGMSDHEVSFTVSPNHEGLVPEPKWNGAGAEIFRRSTRNDFVGGEVD